MTFTPRKLHLSQFTQNWSSNGSWLFLAMSEVNLANPAEILEDHGVAYVLDTHSRGFYTVFSLHPFPHGLPRGEHSWDSIWGTRRKPMAFSSSG